MDLSTLGDLNEFAGNEKTQFMNLAFRVNPALLTTSPYTPLAVGVVYMPTDWLQIGTMVWDTNGSASRTGFDTAFHSPEGISVIQEWDFKIKPFGLPGNQRIGRDLEFEGLPTAAAGQPNRIAGDHDSRRARPKAG